MRRVGKSYFLKQIMALLKQQGEEKKTGTVKKMEKTTIFHQFLFLFFLCLEIFASFHFSRITKAGNFVTLPGNIGKNGQGNGQARGTEFYLREKENYKYK
jgi:hypothetical protein